MACRLAFHYFRGDSLLHRWDARCKLPALLVLTFGLLHARVETLALFTALFSCAVLSTRAPLRALLSDMRAWGVFLLMIFLLQALSTPGAGSSLPAWVPATEESLELATLTCWRLALMLCYAVLFTLVTRPREMQEALLWFMKPLPFLPAQRISLMFSLIMRFIPLLLDEAESVRTAARSRLGNLRRNPLIQIKTLVLPVFRRSILRADEFAVALASRGYREDLPVRLPRIRPAHLFALFLLTILILGSTPMARGRLHEEFWTLLDFLTKHMG